MCYYPTLWRLQSGLSCFDLNSRQSDLMVVSSVANRCWRVHLVRGQEVASRLQTHLPAEQDSGSCFWCSRFVYTSELPFVSETDSTLGAAERKCASCGLGIIGEYVIMNNKDYHPECFGTGQRHHKLPGRPAPR